MTSILVETVSTTQKPKVLPKIPMKISSLKSQEKDKTRFNLFIDGKFVCPVSVDTIFKKKLRAGKELKESDLEDIIKDENFNKMFLGALNILSYRPHSAYEIKLALSRKLNKGHGKTKKASSREDKDKEYQIIDEVIEKLKKTGQVSDKSFAQWWLEQRKTFRPKGALALKKELQERGVGREIIDELLEEQIDRQEDLETAASLLQKRMPRYVNLPPREKREKIIRFLTARGFTWEVVEKVIDDHLEKG